MSIHRITRSYKSSELNQNIEQILMRLQKYFLMCLLDKNIKFQCVFPPNFSEEKAASDIKDGKEGMYFR